MRLIETKDGAGQPNGYVIPLWNARENDWRPDQVYLTAIAPHCSKGPHLHRKRVGRFFCIVGDIEVVTRVDGEYRTERAGQRAGFHVIEVPAGVPAEIRNTGRVKALVLNMPTPAWSADDPDEWPVDGWSFSSRRQ